MSAALHCDGCGASFGYGTEHHCQPVQVSTSTNAVTPPTPTPPEGWEERTEWGVRWENGHNINVTLLSREDAQTYIPSAHLQPQRVTRRVWVEPWREAE